MEREDLIRIFIYGILSSLISTVLAAIGISLGPWGLGFIGIGSAAPPLLFGDILDSASPVLAILLVPICWFFIGMLIGRFTSKQKHAILLWIGCQIVFFVLLIPVVIGWIA